MSFQYRYGCTVSSWNRIEDFPAQKLHFKSAEKVIELVAPAAAGEPRA